MSAKRITRKYNVGDAIVQGDVMLVKLANPTPAAGVRKAQRATVALGEVTGHSHQLQVLDKDETLDIWEQALAELPANVLAAWSLPAGGTELIHDEHPGPVLDEGVWGRISQVEMTEGDARQVAD